MSYSFAGERIAAFACESDLRRFEAIPDLLGAAKAVIATWDEGDLAGAVTLLSLAVAKADSISFPTQQ
jgi:hypothetical protein